jgi:hypothetical protein
MAKVTAKTSIVIPCSKNSNSLLLLENALKFPVLAHREFAKIA